MYTVHNFIVQSALKYKGRLEFAYITDFEFAKTVMPVSEEISENGSVSKFFTQICNSIVCTQFSCTLNGITLQLGLVVHV